MSRADDLLRPFAAMGGDWAMPAYHDLESDIVVWQNSGKYVTAGDVRAARRYLDGASADEPDYRPASDEEHFDTIDCPCGPSVGVEGAPLMLVHNLGTERDPRSPIPAEGEPHE